MARKRILIVDDDPHIIKMIHFYLADEEYEIHYARNGRQAFQILQTVQFEAILADMQMPEMDGITLVKKLKSEMGLHTPIIMVTAHGPMDHAMEAITAGAYDIMQKPFTANRLKLTLRNALNYKTLWDECMRFRQKSGKE